MNRLKRRIAFKTAAFTLVAVAIAVFATTKVALAYQQYDQIVEPCTIVPIDNNGAGPIGSGYGYKTVAIRALTNTSREGATAVSLCTLTQANLTFNGMKPDYVWLGHSAGGAWTARDNWNCVSDSPQIGTSQCVPNPLDFARDTTHDWTFFEDDAAAFYINNFRVACNGMSGRYQNGGTSVKIPGCPSTAIIPVGDDIYSAGTAFPPAPIAPHNCNWTAFGSDCFQNNGGSGFFPIKGAGYLNSSSAAFKDIGPGGSSIVTLAPNGYLNDIDMKMRYRNTYSGNYAAQVAMTFRYPQSDISPVNTFHVTPTASLSVTPNITSTTAENPNTATFKSNISINTQIANNGIHYTRKFYIKHPTGPVTNFSGFDNTGTSGAAATSSVPFADATFSLNGPYAVSLGDQVCAEITATPESGTVNTSTHIIITGSGTTDPLPQPACVDIVNVPYSKFLGSDVFAGGGFGSACTTPTTSASIHTFNNADYSGSSTQFADQVLGNLTGPNITGHSSANPGGNPILNPPNGLVLNNNGTIGSFSGQHCIPDYWGSMPPGVLPIPKARACFDFAELSNDVNAFLGARSAALLLTPTNVKDKGTVTFGDLQPNGNCRNLDASLVPKLNPGTHFFVYIDGNLRVNENLIFETNGWNTTADIPLIYFIVKGNIYIDHFVDQMDGIYVAQNVDGNPNSKTQGNIYTCTRPTNEPEDPFGPDSDEVFSRLCRNHQLKVNGTFIANKIFFQRTQNSLRDSQALKTAGIPETSANSTAAEIFQLSPDIYLSDFCAGYIPNLGSLCGTGPPDDSFTNLPPIL